MIDECATWRGRPTGCATPSSTRSSPTDSRAATRVAKPGPLEPWDAPPTTYGFKGGDLLGIVEHLDYLADLGVTALYLRRSSRRRRTTATTRTTTSRSIRCSAATTPCASCSTRAHARGMRVVLDGVFNHSGRGFWPFHHVVENGAASPYVDWFYVDQATRAGGCGRPAPAVPSCRAQRVDATRGAGLRAWWDLPALPKLNTDNPEMREHLMGAAEHWLRFGIDGWRLDVAEEIDAELLARVPAARAARSTPTRTSSAEIWRRSPNGSAGDTFDALDELPARPRRCSRSRRRASRRGGSRSSTSTAIRSGRSTGRSSRRGSAHIMSDVPARDDPRPAQPARAATTLRAT